jgi:uncharacterized protein (DUF1697 family)
MTAFVALARGINVGGARLLPMAALREMFAAAGAVRVETLIQSGNVVFEAGRAEGEAIVGAAGPMISRAFGFSPAFVTRDADRWRSMISGNPYLPRGADPEKLHVACLSAPPAPETISRLDLRFAAPDEFSACEDSLYLYLPNGAARSKLTNAKLDAAFGVVSTLRNWTTALRIDAALSRRRR